MKNKRYSFLLKALVSIALMTLLIWKIDLGRIITAFSGLDVAWFSLATFFFFLQQIIVAYCWKIVLDAQVSQVSLLKVTQVHFIGIFFGVLLPTSIGMDIVRAFSLSRHMTKKVDAMSSLFFVRVVGYFVFFFLALMFAMYVAIRSGNFVFAGIILGMAALFVLLVWISLHPVFHKWIEKVLDKLKLWRFSSKLGEFRSSTIALLNEKTVFIKVVAYSIFFQVFGIYIVYLVGRSVGIELGLVYYFIYVPVIMAITILPLSLAGIGLREGAFVFFFAPLGVPEAKSLTLSLLLFSQMLILAVIGGGIYLFSDVITSKTVH